MTYCFLADEPLQCPDSANWDNDDRRGRNCRIGPAVAAFTMTCMKLQVVPMVVAALVTGCGATSVTSPPAISTGSPAGQSPASTQIPASPATSVSAAPAADTGAMRFTWSEIPFEGSVSAITGDGSRFVAVGTGSDGVSSWTSSDGIAWEEHDVPERSFDVGDGSGREFTAAVSQLVRLGDTLYAFGGFQFMDSITTVGWRWTDGSQWELIESDSPFFLGGITQVTASDEALFAINSGFMGGPLLSPSTWLWTPATSWVQTRLTSSADAEITVHASTWGNGTFIAVGSEARSVEGVELWDWPRTPSMWTSADGRGWTATQLPDGASSVCSMTPLPTGGFVAFGRTGDRAASWTSMDGGDWVEGTIGLPAGPGVGATEQDVTPCNVVAFDGGLMASAPVEGATFTWTSRDGQHWSFDQRLDISTVHLSKLASVGDQVLLFGSRVAPEAGSGLRDVLLRGTSSPGT